jgi:hypothetical protein
VLAQGLRWVGGRIQGGGRVLWGWRTWLHAHRGRRLAVEIVVVAVCLAVAAYLVGSSGRLGVSAGVVVGVAVALVVPLESRITWRRVIVLAGPALAVAFFVSLIQDMYVDGPDGRTHATAITAVVLPVTVGLADRWSKLLWRLLDVPSGGGIPAPGAGTPPPERLIRHWVLAGILCMALSAVLLVRPAWLPGMANDCYTPPDSSAMTVLVQDDDGTCYGMLDTSDPGLFATGSFGTNDNSRLLEKQLLDGNQPLGEKDLTVIWLGSLSCTAQPKDAAGCAGKDYPAERDQLRGLLLAQAWTKKHTPHRVHVVIADATQDVRHVEDVAHLITDHRAAFGPRTLVIGGGDSRDVTVRAILHLLDAGIPFIAPNLLADLGAPGQPLVEAAGYLQLPPPNIDYARDVVRRLRAGYRTGFRLTVYQAPASDDLYTTSLVNDVFYAMDELRRMLPASARGKFSARHADDLAQLDPSVCGADPGRPPGVLFFADRWSTFGAFLKRVNELCGQSTPRQVIADGSVSRFMANVSQRTNSTSVWPLDYYVGGPGCVDLRPDDAAFFADLVKSTLHPSKGYSCGGAEASPPALSSVSSTRAATYCTLEASQSSSRPCQPTDLGNFVLPLWDAVMLADRMLRDAPAVGGHLDMATLSLANCRLTAGVAQVQKGHLVGHILPVELWHVDQIANPKSPPMIKPTTAIPPSHAFAACWE